MSIYTYDPYLSNDVVEIGQLKDFVLKIGLNPTVLADKKMEFRICHVANMCLCGARGKGIQEMIPNCLNARGNGDRDERGGMLFG